MKRASDHGATELCSLTVVDVWNHRPFGLSLSVHAQPADIDFCRADAHALHGSPQQARRRDSRNVMRSFVPEGVRRIAQRVSWTVGDQILSALSNVLLAVLVARTADAAGFGAFSMAFLVFSIMIGLTRAAVGQPLQISFAAAATRQFRSAVRSALGGATLIGVFTGAVVGAFGLVLGGETGSALIAVAVCLPGLLVQDTCRMAFFAAGLPKRAAAIDALWSGLLFALLAVVIALAMDQIWIPIAIWGATAAAAALYGMHLLEAIPRIRGAVSWLLAQRKLTGYLIAEYFLGQGIAQIGILAVAIVGTEEGVGALRAAQVLIGPLNILGAAAFMFAIPEIARRPQMSQRSRGVFCAGVSSAMGAGHRNLLHRIAGNAGQHRRKPARRHLDGGSISPAPDVSAVILCCIVHRSCHHSLWSGHGPCHLHDQYHSRTDAGHLSVHWNQLVGRSGSSVGIGGNGDCNPAVLGGSSRHRAAETAGADNVGFVVNSHQVREYRA